LQADVDKLRIQADMLKTHEQLTSQENIAQFEATIQQQMAEVNARISEVAANNQAERETIAKALQPPIEHQPEQPGA
jgi:hypothetical protein